MSKALSKEAEDFAAKVAEAVESLERSQFLTCRVCYLARQKETEPWFSRQWRTFKSLCEDVLGFSERRGYQLADAYEVCKNLADYAGEPDVTGFFREWLVGFTERHARVLAPLPAHVQAQAWQAAQKIEDSPSTTVLAQVVDEFKVTPEAIAAMPAREQREILVAIEKKAKAGYDRKYDVALAKLAMKRLRKILADGKGRAKLKAAIEATERANAEWALVLAE